MATVTVMEHVNMSQEEKVPNYAYAFHLLTDNLDKLPGTLKVADM